jgi:hypothetical protein
MGYSLDIRERIIRNMKKRNKSKKPQPYCKNCLLYDFHKRHCRVVVLYEGQKINPPTEPNDKCLFEDTYQSINEEGRTEVWKPEVQQVKWWCEDKEGNKAAKGQVKIEYPKGFFGDEK